MTGLSQPEKDKCPECGQEKPAPPKDYWTPDVGDEVWTNRPDGDRQGKVVGFVEDGPRKGQPIIEAMDERKPAGRMGIGGVKVGDKHVCHPMFLLPFEFGSPEWKKARAEGRVG